MAASRSTDEASDEAIAAKGNHYEATNASEKGTDIVELLEAIAYLICQDDPIRTDTFFKIFSSRGVPAKILRLADTNYDGVVSVEEMMNFIMIITNPRRNKELTAESVKHLEKVFRENLAKDKDEFTLAEFKKIVPSKNPFFVERAFRIFDRDKNGSVSMAEFIDAMHQFAGNGADEKLVFLFKVYDLDDDGLIQQSDLREVMKACMEENGMNFDEKEVEGLAQALYEDAAGLAAGEDVPGHERVCPGITVDDLKAELAKHEGLLENLSISIGKWLVPPTPPKPKPWSQRLQESLPQQFSAMYWRNNKQFIAFLFLLTLINVVLFVMRAHYFKDFSTLAGNAPNGFYMMSRANGRVLLFNSTIILVLVLRYSITKLRELGLAFVLPLDNNIYLHKVVGWLIFVQSFFHTVMHLLNFAINVQPDPARFVQLTSHYWEDFGHQRPGWLNLNYNLPPGCTVSNSTDLCQSVGSPLQPAAGVLLCQVCDEDSRPWTYYEWLFTTKPGVFGLIGGVANPSGIALMAIMAIMVVCSLPFVRRGGYFEVFYFTHLLYIAYWTLLIFHAPEFWKWILAPGIIFMLEITYRVLSSLMGKGKTSIFAGVVLPSRVTNLIIRRPHNFNFSPGDWVFVKIPAIAKSEWHPFTISSAPEQQDFFTLHIRGVGQWTNRLYTYFEEEYRRQQNGKIEEQSGLERFRGTVHRNYHTFKNALSVYNKGHRTVERDPSDPTFQSLASKYQHDPERSRLRMKMREERLRARESNGFPPSSPSSVIRNRAVQQASTKESHNKSFRYMRRQPSIVQYAPADDPNNNDGKDGDAAGVNGGSGSRRGGGGRLTGGGGGGGKAVKTSNKSGRDNVAFIPPSADEFSMTEMGQGFNLDDDGPGKKMTLRKPLEIFVDGPFGAPSSNIFRAEHAVLIGTGIGVTPFASILQSIMHRYWQVKRNCPRCDYQWSDELHSVFSLKKVDFFWINRDQKSFEWFVKLLSQLEIEQSEQDGVMGHFLDMHMYITSALQRTDMKAVGLQLALDLLHEKEKRDLVTGLKSRTIAGRPNWNKVFTQVREQRKGRVTVFYCGNPSLAKIVRKKCNEFKFIFRKEVF